MIPPTHLLVSWALANTVAKNRRERTAITLAGVVPDLDGFGYPIENWWTFHWENPLLWYSDYHHILCHNVCFALFVAIVVYRWTRCLTTTVAAFASFHLHLLCDVIGSRGIDDCQWPIPYFLPFSNAVQWTWSGQWELGAWQNRAIGSSLFLWSLVWAYRRGYSPLEVFSEKWDARFIPLWRRMVAEAISAIGGKPLRAK